METKRLIKALFLLEEITTIILLVEKKKGCEGIVIYYIMAHGFYCRLKYLVFRRPN